MVAFSCSTACTALPWTTCRHLLKNMIIASSICLVFYEEKKNYFYCAETVWLPKFVLSFELSFETTYGICYTCFIFAVFLNKSERKIRLHFLWAEPALRASCLSLEEICASLSAGESKSVTPDIRMCAKNLRVSCYCRNQNLLVMYCNVTVFFISSTVVDSNFHLRISN